MLNVAPEMLGLKENILSFCSLILFLLFSPSPPRLGIAMGLIILFLSVNGGSLGIIVPPPVPVGNNLVLV